MPEPTRDKHAVIVIDGEAPAGLSVAEDVPGQRLLGPNSTWRY